IVGCFVTIFILFLVKQKNKKSKGVFLLLQMIKKLTPISLLAVLLFLIIPEHKTSASSYEDGTYNITANALHIDKDEPSVAADYINEAAEVIVENGEMNLQVTVPKNEDF